MPARRLHASTPTPPPPEEHENDTDRRSADRPVRKPRQNWSAAGEGVFTRDGLKRGYGGVVGFGMAKPDAQASVRCVPPRRRDVALPTDVVRTPTTASFLASASTRARKKSKPAGSQPTTPCLSCRHRSAFFGPPRVRFAGVPPLTAPALQAAIQTHLAFFDTVVGLLHIPSHRLQRSQQSKYNKMNLLHSLRNGPKQPTDCVSGTSRARIANPVSDLLCTGPI